MKKRILSVIVAGVILLTSIGPMIKAKAEPTEVEKNRSQYEQLKQEVRQINEKIEITEKVELQVKLNKKIKIWQ